MRKAFLFAAVLWLAPSLFAQTSIVYGGDWSFANANSTVPNVVGIGPPPTANCQLNPMHRGRTYTRLDPASLNASVYICMETVAGNGIYQWNLQSGTGGGGTPTFDAILSGTNVTATMVVGSGASLAPTSATAGVLSANEINGARLSSLATGILKNTTATGVPSIAVSGTDYAPATTGSGILKGSAGGFAAAASADVVSLFSGGSGCTGTNLLAANGTCQSAGSSPLTTKGDLFGYSTVAARVPIGGDGTVLTADSTQTLGLKWATVTGTGTVTVVGAGNLTSTALVTGGGSQTIQTPSATATLDTSGNIVTPGGMTTGSGGSVAGYHQFGQGTAPSLGTTAITVYAPSSVPFSYGIILPGAAGGGLLAASVSGNLSTLSFTNAIGAVTATSLLASGIVDGEAPSSPTTQSACTLGTSSAGCAGSYKSGYSVNEHATSGQAVTYTLPTAAAGLQYCVGNGYNGSAANTGALTIQTSASGQFIINTDGTLSASGGYMLSGGAAGDFACVFGVDATHWYFRPGQGSWSKH